MVKSLAIAGFTFHMGISVFGTQAQCGGLRQRSSLTTVSEPPCEPGTDLGPAYARNVNSPFTDEEYLVQDTLLRICDDDGPCYSPPYDQAGFMRRGCPLSQSDLGTPCYHTGEVQVRRSVLCRGSEAEPYLYRRANLEWTTTDSILHQEWNGSLASHLDLSWAHEIQSGMRRGSLTTNDGVIQQFEYGLGTETAPVRKFTSAQYLEPFGGRHTLRIDGPFHYDGEGCQLGDFAVNTTRDFKLETVNLNFRSLEGRVEITALRGTATAEVNADGSWTVVDVDGDSRTFYSAEELKVAMGSCWPHVQQHAFAEYF